MVIPQIAHVRVRLTDYRYEVNTLAQGARRTDSGLSNKHSLNDYTSSQALYALDLGKTTG